MTNQEILEKAIQKAIDGGYRTYKDKFGNYCETASEVIDDGNLRTYEIIFNHDFAKALFGNEPYYRFDGDTLETPTQWQYHLQQMVIADDPIKYLGENL